MFNVGQFYVEPKEEHAMVCNEANFRLEPVAHRLAWCQHDPTEAERLLPMEVYFQLDIEQRSISVATYYQSSVVGVPARAAYGLLRRYELSPFTDSVDLTADVNAGQFDELLRRILAGASIQWDGHNHVGCLTDAASDAEGELESRLATYARVLDTGGLWEAGDWLQLCSASDFGITAQTTDEEIWAIAQRETANALTEDVILVDAEEYFSGLRDQLREEITDEDEAETLV